VATLKTEINLEVKGIIREEEAVAITIPLKAEVTTSRKAQADLTIITEINSSVSQTLRRNN
jgi:hypothetical protein